MRPSAGKSPGRSLALLLVLLHGGRRVVVQSLRHELQGQAVLVAGGLFDLGPLILEPDFDLGLVQVEFLGQRLSPLLRYVAVGLELVFQSLQLLGRERCPGPLVLLAALLLFQFPCPRAWCGNNSGNKIFILQLNHEHNDQICCLYRLSVPLMSDDCALLSVNMIKCRSPNRPDALVSA